MTPIRETTGNSIVPVASYRLCRDLAVTTSSARKALPTGYLVVTLKAVDCRMKFKLGDGTVAAALADDGADGALEAGDSIDVPVRAGETHVAAIAVAGSGTLYVMGRT